MAPVFASIKNFVLELSSSFGDRNRPLAMYGRLIQHTVEQHVNAVEKHTAVFRTFVVTNKNAILTTDPKLLTDPKIRYNERVYINVRAILDMADLQTRQVIWKHLLVLSAHLDETSCAREKIRDVAETSPPLLSPSPPPIPNLNLEALMGNEFLGSLMGMKGAAADPSGMLSMLMNSDILTGFVQNLQSGMSDGTFDPMALLATLQSTGMGAAEDSGGADGPPPSVPDVEQILRMFESVGISKKQMRDMVGKIHDLLSEEPTEAPVPVPAHT